MDGRSRAAGGNKGALCQSERAATSVPYHDRPMADADRLRDLNDPALWPLVDASGEQGREEVIAVLVTRCARPLIETVLKRFRRTEPDVQTEDLEEISSLVVLRLIRKLRAAAVYEDHAIAVFHSYVSALAHNACHDFRRLRYPERYRLKRNLRYIMGRHAAFALWETPEDVVAGLAQWRGSAPGPAGDPFAATKIMRDRARPAEALQAVFERIGHPVAFESLLDLVAELWDVRDVVVERDEFPPDERSDQLSVLEQRQSLERLWREILELPQNQRAALLLNLRDSTGANALALFVLLQIADAAEVARVTGLTPCELNEIWCDLPLDDLTIAARLGLTRQQIINLRKSARLRLSRRMARI